MTKKYAGLGAIFCGGNSSRMGTPKAGLILANGRSMIESVYDSLHSVCEDVVLIGHGDGVPTALNHIPRLADNFKNCGPLGGLEALLSSNLADEYMTAPCDLINCQPQLFTFLSALDGERPIVLKGTNGLEPLVGRYSANLLPVIQTQINLQKYTIHKLISLAEGTIVTVPREYESFLANANTPDQVKKLESG